MTEPEPHDAHVVLATRIFRKAGVSLLAMQFPRPPEALEALKRFNGVADHFVPPIPWHYFPNQWCRDNWKETYEDYL